MRVRELLKIPIKRYIVWHTKPSRGKQREVASKSRSKGMTKHGLAKTKPKNWTRDRHKRRVEQKRRRKQRWKA